MKNEHGCRPDQLFGLWAIEPVAFGAMVVAARDADLAELRAEAAAAPAASKPLYTVDRNGLARIDVSGPMTKYPTSFQSVLGGTATLRTREAFRAAERDREVRGIMAVFDSPGGTVAGTSDLAEDIRSVDKRKPVYAYAWDQMASAALFAGLAARRVYANKAASVGSIGMFTVVRDTSGNYSQRGVKTFVVSSAPPLKGAGTDGTEVTPEQLADWERWAKERADGFVADLASDRGMSREQADSLHTGQSWSSEKAQTLGLIDGVMSLDDAMARLLEEAMQEKELTDAKAAADAATAKLAEEQQARQKAEAEAAELRARLSSIEIAQRNERFVAEAKAYGVPAEVASVLDTIEARCGAATYAALAGAMKALRAQVDESRLFAEKGAASPTNASASALDQAKALAEAKVKDGKAKTFHEGLKAVWKENPRLWEQHEKERQG